MKIKLRAIFCLGFPFCCSFHLANYFSYSILKFAVFFSHSFFYSFLPCVTSFGLVLSHVYWVLSPEKCTRALSGAIFLHFGRYSLFHYLFNPCPCPLPKCRMQNSTEILFFPPSKQLFMH